jgi:hypothetical protein
MESIQAMHMRIFWSWIKCLKNYSKCRSVGVMTSRLNDLHLSTLGQFDRYPVKKLIDIGLVAVSVMAPLQ